LLVELGFASPDLVARWADLAIETEPETDPAFFELSLAGSSRPAQVLDLLEDYRDAPSRPAAWELVLPWVAAKVRANDLELGSAIRRIWALSSSSRVETEKLDKLENRFSVLEDAYACARDGIYGSMPEVRADLLETLDTYGRPGALSGVAG